MLATQSRLDLHRSAVPSSAHHRRYVRHQPEESLLYAIVEKHVEGFFAHLGERNTVLPGFVRDRVDQR